MGRPKKDAALAQEQTNAKVTTISVENLIEHDLSEDEFADIMKLLDPNDFFTPDSCKRKVEYDIAAGEQGIRVKPGTRGEGSTQFEIRLFDLMSKIPHYASPYKLRATKDKDTGLSWWVSSKGEAGMVSKIRLMSHEYTKDEYGNYVVPTYFFDFFKLHEEFKSGKFDVDMTQAQVTATMNLRWGTAMKSDPVGWDRRGVMLAWLRSQPLINVVKAMYLNKEKNALNEKAMRSAYGTVIYEPLEYRKLKVK